MSRVGWTADRDRRARLGRIDLGQVARRHRVHLAARHRIARDAAPEPVELAGQPLLVALAQEIDLGGDPVARPVVEREAADRGEQPGGADADLDLAADLRRRGDRGIGVARDREDRVAVEHHPAGRPADRGHDADRLQRGGPGGSGGRGKGVGRGHVGHGRNGPSGSRPTLHGAA
jgi:hypothetical protein